MHYFEHAWIIELLLTLLLYPPRYVYYNRSHDICYTGQGSTSCALPRSSVDCSVQHCLVVVLEISKAPVMKTTTLGQAHLLYYNQATPVEDSLQSTCNTNSCDDLVM